MTHVYVAPKEEQSAVFLWEVHLHARVLGVQESKFPFRSKRHANLKEYSSRTKDKARMLHETSSIRNVSLNISAPSTHRAVLVFGAKGVEGGAVVVVGLPVAGVPVPVEPRPHALARHLEVVPHLVLDLLKSRASLWAFADEVSSLGPRDPV